MKVNNFYQNKKNTIKSHFNLMIILLELRFEISNIDFFAKSKVIYWIFKSSSD